MVYCVLAYLKISLCIAHWPQLLVIALGSFLAVFIKPPEHESLVLGSCVG